MSVSIPLIKETLANMSEKDLSALGDMYNAELYRRYRHGVNRPPQMEHPIASTRDALVERYGLDGRKLIGNDRGAIEEIPKYLLDALPFKTSYDEDVNFFSWIPEGWETYALCEMLSNEPNFELGYAGKIELLLDPELKHYSAVLVRDTKTGNIYHSFKRPLKWLVEWYLGAKAHEHMKPIELRAVVFGEGAQLLTQFKGKDITMDYTVRGATFKTAPVLIGKTIDIGAASTLGGLANESLIHPSSEPGKLMQARSVWVDVGGHLIRMMTESNPMSTFVRSPNPGSDNMMLDMVARTVIQHGQTDAFGDPYQFMALVEEDDSFTIEVRVRGIYNPRTGELTFTADPVRVDVTGGTRAEIVGSLMLEQIKVLAVEPKGDIVIY